MKIFFNYSFLRTNKKQSVQNKQNFNFRANKTPIITDNAYTLEEFNKLFQSAYGDWLQKCKPETEMMTGGKFLEVFRNKDGFPIKEIYSDSKKNITEIFEHLYNGKICISTKKIK